MHERVRGLFMNGVSMNVSVNATRLPDPPPAPLQPVPVPQPGTLLLLGGGLVAAKLANRRRTAP